MKIWTNKEFHGFWPVGTAAVIIADTAEIATEKLNAALVEHGLKPTAEAKDMICFEYEDGNVRILNDGVY